MMNAPFSLEHTGPAVTPLSTFTPSALNTWVWEEGRIVGAAVDWWRSLSNGMRFSLLVGSGFGPDQMGRLLAARGRQEETFSYTVAGGTEFQCPW